MILLTMSVFGQDIIKFNCDQFSFKENNGIFDINTSCFEGVGFEGEEMFCAYSNEKTIFCSDEKGQKQVKLIGSFSKKKDLIKFNSIFLEIKKGMNANDFILQ